MEDAKKPDQHEDRESQRLLNETTARRQEEALARRLAEAFDKFGAPAAGQCPDPEQIAAYHEHALSPEKAASCESHFAQCQRCRTILNVLAAASSEAPLAESEVARLGQLAAAKPQLEPSPKPQPDEHPLPQPVPLPSRTSRRPRWLVPAVAVAAVLVIVLAVRPIWRDLERNSSRTLVAQAPAPIPPASETAPLTPEAPQLAGKESTPESGLPPVNPAAPEAPPKQPPETKTQAQVDNLVRGASDYTPPNTPVRNEPSAGASSSAATPRAQAAPPASPPNPAAQPPPSSQAASGSSSSFGATGGQAPQASVQAQNSAPAAADNKTVAESRDNARNPQQVARLAAPMAAIAGSAGGFAALVRSPSAASMVLWRAGTGGRIERSTDGGRTWQSQQSPVKDDWLAGNAASDTVCWLVGRNSVVARTSDGRTWVPVAPPSIEDNSGRKPDWTGVMATDADNAVLTARDGQQYATHDGGRTWQKR